MRILRKSIPVVTRRGNPSYQHLKIVPIITDSLRIKLNGSEYFHGNGKLYLKTDACPRLVNWSLCSLSSLKDVTSDNFLSNIIIGQDGSCTYETIEHFQSVIEMSPTIILLNDVNDTLYNNCGISDRQLVGSFLITYQNCTVSIHNTSFTNQVMEAVEHPIFSLNVTKQHIIQRTDIHSL